MRIPFTKIPTYNADIDIWSETDFTSQEHFKFFLERIFREPGEYNFDESTLKWNALGRKFTEKKFYTMLARGTQDWKKFWDFEKRKSRLGVIWHSKGETWYLCREYYMLLNFLPITNKEKGFIESFCDVRDTQYHLQLYERIAEASHEHSGLVKKRQMLSSYYHCAKLINIYWFEKNKNLKMMASDDRYVSGKQGSWLILIAYRDFLNQHTPWYRHSEPDKMGEWQQKIRTKRGGRWISKGNKSSLISITLKQDPQKGVGGPTYIGFYEEAGIAPTMDTTKAFLDPALESGLETVGTFIAAGSVGDLDDCKPLEKMIRNPRDYRIHAVPCRNYDETGVIKECGLFIPTQYGMPPYVDQYGNSLVKEAIEALLIAYKEWESLPEEEYRLKLSQNPMTLKHAFDFRGTSYFPASLIERRQQVIKDQIKEKIIKPLKGVMREDDQGNPIFVPRDKLPVDEQPPEMGYPINPKDKDKRGVTLIYQLPKEKPDFGIYFGGVDSIEANVTSTSDSLFCVAIVSRRIEVHKEDDKGARTIQYEGGKLMAIYAGRYDDINDTNKQGELLIRFYNALSAIERNKANFINHLRSKGFSKLVAKRREMSLFKEVDMTGFDNDEYGIYLGSDGKANEIINQNILEDITTTLDVIHKKNKDGSMGEIVKTVRGIDLVDDHWTLEELKLHTNDRNTDRRVAFGLAKTLAKCHELTAPKRVYETAKKKEEPRREGFSLLGSRPPKRPRSIL